MTTLAARDPLTWTFDADDLLTTGYILGTCSGIGLDVRVEGGLGRDAYLVITDPGGTEHPVRARDRLTLDPNSGHVDVQPAQEDR